MCTGGSRTRRAHGSQSALCLPEPWLLQGGRQPHAALRQDAVRGQAVFQHGHGQESALATADGRHQLFLCRHTPRFHALFAANRHVIACVLIVALVCAELVAAILKEGGLLEASSNPGSATPETLHKIYQSRAAATANPYVLRDLNATTGLSFCNTMGAAAAQCHQRSGASTSAGGTAEEREALLQHRSIMAPVPPPNRPMTTASALGERRRADSPPRGHFRVITHVGSGRPGASNGTVGAAASMCAHGTGLMGGGSSGRTARAVRAAEAAAAASTGTSSHGTAVAANGQRTGMCLTLHSLDMRSLNAL